MHNQPSYTASLLVLILKLAQITQFELANLLGTTQASVSRYISGDQKLPSEKAELLTQIIGEHNLFLLQTFDGSMIAIGNDLEKRMKTKEGD
ncbi:transcriptional regulator [Bacillus sp. AY3-1]|uniref:transcriptional regulator n=1 Tax=Bacillus cereus group TaxID=86661 RepID=UPI000BFA674C|nr:MULTISPECIES: transcriptional regulator [Bacillus cereus group]KAA0747498.1 transcriptional regulator [Bacillus sp. AY3-1]MBE7149901.1 transcriptional regulator [Bacillus mycoides]PGE31851.1 transcriptional regulator [Bacillus wiedmannii]